MKALEQTRMSWKPPTDLYKLTISSLGPTSFVNPLLDVKVIIS
jgi:hypothetical protein